MNSGDKQKKEKRLGPNVMGGILYDFFFDSIFFFELKSKNTDEMNYKEIKMCRSTNAEFLQTSFLIIIFEKGKNYVVKEIKKKNKKKKNANFFFKKAKNLRKQNRFFFFFFLL